MHTHVLVIKYLCMIFIEMYWFHLILFQQFILQFTSARNFIHTLDFHFKNSYNVFALVPLANRLFLHTFASWYQFTESSYGNHAQETAYPYKNDKLIRMTQCLPSSWSKWMADGVISFHRNCDQCIGRNRHGSSCNKKKHYVQFFSQEY